MILLNQPGKTNYSILLITLILVLVGFSGCSKQDETPDSETRIYTIETFEDVRHAFGEDHSQRAEGVFEFPTDPTQVSDIKMYVKLRCPDEGCNAWDMFANIKIQDPETEKWLEMGRYITPYGVDNAQAGRGFMINVTDFKSLLTGQVKLQSFIEVWANDGWLVSVEFQITEGNPDYPYYSIAPVLDYADWSLGGVPYGEEHEFDLQKTLSIPAVAEETQIRTIITGWGHATPTDSDGRPCAEWCFRTHSVWINDVKTFDHPLEPIGCPDNPVQPQFGNWEPDRAGWCPGMEVPVRKNTLENPMDGSSFSLSYSFQDWSNNFQSSSDNKHAYYAISIMMVTKSNSPIEKTIVESSR